MDLTNDDEASSARTVVLVEGVSDQMAVEALAVRRGRDLGAEGIAVIPMGGSKNIGRSLVGSDRSASTSVGTFGGRKIRSAPLLVDALDLSRVPRLLDRLLDDI